MESSRRQENRVHKNANGKCRRRRFEIRNFLLFIILLFVHNRRQIRFYSRHRIYSRFVCNFIESKSSLFFLFFIFVFGTFDFASTANKTSQIFVRVKTTNENVVRLFQSLFGEPLFVVWLGVVLICLFNCCAELPHQPIQFRQFIVGLPLFETSFRHSHARKSRVDCFTGSQTKRMAFVFWSFWSLRLSAKEWRRERRKPMTKQTISNKRRNK